jgi:hypothetical protein
MVPAGAEGEGEGEKEKEMSAGSWNVCVVQAERKEN